jgi:hypothetical protein
MAGAPGTAVGPQRSERCDYQFSEPWQELAHVLDDAFQPMLVPTLGAPFMWVVAVTPDVAYPEPWHVEHAMLRPEWSECLPEDGGAPWHVLHDCVGGVYVQDCDVTGEPPVQPEGEEVRTVRVCVLLGWQAPQAE